MSRLRKSSVVVSSGKANILMKGLLDTSILMKAVLDKEIGLRGKGVLSHVAVFEIGGRDELLYMTDAAMNIADIGRQGQYNREFSGSV